jgi:hypothetical protein
MANARNIGLQRSNLKIGLDELALGAFLLAGFIFLIIWLSTSPPKQQAEREKALPDMYSGSIVIPSSDNAECRWLTFDNKTGSIKDQGRRDCSAGEVRGRAEVLSAISNSFRGK